MSNLKGIYAALTVCGLVSACTPETMSPNCGTESKLEMSLAQNPLTRAHFEDRNGTATFVWDADARMIAAAGHAGSLVEWAGGEFFSPMNITYINPEDSHKVLRANYSLTIPCTAAAVGDRMSVH